MGRHPPLPAFPRPDGPAGQPAALGLIVFTVLASVALLDFWNQPAGSRTAAQNAFTGNIALIGGLILACAIG